MTKRIRRWPWLTFGIIAICTLVQIYAEVAAPSATAMRDLLAQTRAAPTQEAADALAQQLLAMMNHVPSFRFGYHTGSGLSFTLITSAFVHAGWWHLIGNMLFLFLVGSVLEDRWGSVKWGVFYLVGAVASTYGYSLFSGAKEQILVGASGAISAGMGAVLVYNPKTRIKFWYWWWAMGSGLRSGTFELAVYIALPFWFIEQVLWTKLEGNAGISGVAYSAHIAGFAFGVIVSLAMASIWGRGEQPDDTDDARASTKARTDPDDALRFSTCMSAIRSRDMTQIRAVGSRTILDLSRSNAHVRVLEIYSAIAKLDSIPLTDGAFAAAARAADAIGDGELYIAIANAFMREHPGSAQLPKVMWAAAHFHRAAGRDDLAR